MSRHLLTRNISSKSMHAFFSNLANRQTDRQTDKQTWAKTCTSSFVAGKNLAKKTTFLHAKHYNCVERTRAVKQLISLIVLIVQ